MRPPPNPSPDLTHFGNPDNANPSSATTSADASSAPPAIKINGDNPAHVSLGETYNDLGATITAPEADKNLGIKTFLNGALVSDIVLDTTEAATDTVQYVATDPNGLSATSTRTIIVDPATAPSLVPDYNASTTVEVAITSAQ
jgi:hypothetical protein